MIQAAAYATIGLCAAVILFLVGFPLLSRKAPSQSYWCAGLMIHGLVFAAIILAAYSNSMPPWLSGKEVRHYDTFMHFYLTGLMTYFLEGALVPKPARLGVLRIPRTSVILVVIGALDESVFQPLFSHRTASWHDFFGNAAGAIIFGCLARKVANLSSDRIVSLNRAHGEHVRSGFTIASSSYEKNDG